MTAAAPSVASDGIDANDAYAELARQYGLLAGQIIQQQMLLDKRGARIIELEAAVRDSRPTPDPAG